MSYIYERKQPFQLFHDLKRMGRDNFSYEGAQAIMEYLEQIAQDTSDPIEYDPIAICCDYSEWQRPEYARLAEEQGGACPQRAHYQSDDEFEAALIERLEQQTTVIRFEGGIVIQSF